MAYTAYKLTGEAKRWWQDKKAVLVANLGSKTAISWDIFKYEFCCANFNILANVQIICNIMVCKCKVEPTGNYILESKFKPKII